MKYKIELTPEGKEYFSLAKAIIIFVLHICGFIAAGIIGLVLLVLALAAAVVYLGVVFGAHVNTGVPLVIFTAIGSAVLGFSVGGILIGIKRLVLKSFRITKKRGIL